ncbi:MAG: competence/damage-inducible protein A [Acidobacteria bacterium]|nr:competence/damage-inducible protein A [Acidobacteriota bacterium]
MSESLPGPARAAVVAVGSELLTLGRADTNSPYIAAALQRAGLKVAYTTVVGDERGDLTAALSHALSQADLVVCTGGLGPTEDDRTRDAAAEVVGRPMHEDASVLATIEERFRRRGLTMPDINRRQAQVPAGATVIPNQRGSAPGLWIPAGPAAVLLLPGPPREMVPMLEEALAAYVAPRWGGVTCQRALVVAGRSESWVDERAASLYGPWHEEPLPITTTILASLGIVEIHLSCHGDEAAPLAQRLEAALAVLADTFGADVVSRDGRSLEQAVGDLLAARKWRVALAESCTGGLVTTRLTDIAGASAYVDRAVVAYSNDAKRDALGVPSTLLEEHGAVSEPVAAAMAEGVRMRAGADVALAVTGIAGPGGGTVEKPVGMVCLAVTGARGTEVRTLYLAGDRGVVRSLAATAALDMLRHYVLAGQGA